MATMKDVAEKAGVSEATVSYVPNEAQKVRPGTQQRVLAAAKELLAEGPFRKRTLSARG
jgi:DNA-binding LacI/PurR family transcriptional regulator